MINTGYELQEAKIGWMICHEDDLAEGDTKTVELKKDVPQTVELSFGGWPSYPYWIYIKADNTKVNITINPLAK